MNNNRETGYLILKSGKTLKGKLFGHIPENSQSTKGELVFTTGMVGYPETLTDPSFKDQIVTFSFPLIGNYGMPDEKIENQIHKHYESSKAHLKGIIVSQYSENYSHWHAKKSLEQFMIHHKITGLTDIDTRALIEHLRDNGSEPAIISPIENPELNFYDPNQTNLVKQVSIESPTIYKNGPITIAMLDCGVKNNTIRNFINRNITILRLPWNYNFFEKPILDENNQPYKIHGLFISNGPGDPSLLTETINICKQAISQNLPIFGICLGNQILGLAAGAKTYKLPFGHRGQNQPCINPESSNCVLTSQNHGFALDESTLPSDWKILFKNINDNTIEGIEHKTQPFFAVQFHPEASPGPVDTENLFDKFINLLKTTI